MARVEPSQRPPGRQRRPAGEPPLRAQGGCCSAWRRPLSGRKNEEVAPEHELAQPAWEVTTSDGKGRLSTSARMSAVARPIHPSSVAVRVPLRDAAGDGFHVPPPPKFTTREGTMTARARSAFDERPDAPEGAAGDARGMIEGESAGG